MLLISRLLFRGIREANVRRVSTFQVDMQIERDNVQAA
jgi:hypothetical protein